MLTIIDKVGIINKAAKNSCMVAIKTLGFPEEVNCCKVFY